MLKAQQGAWRYPQQAGQIWSQFDAIWLQSTVIASRVGDSIIWNRQRPV